MRYRTVTEEREPGKLHRQNERLRRDDLPGCSFDPARAQREAETQDGRKKRFMAGDDLMSQDHNEGRQASCRILYRGGDGEGYPVNIILKPLLRRSPCQSTSFRMNAQILNISSLTQF